jgi:hypothetical protein
MAPSGLEVNVPAYLLTPDEPLTSASVNSIVMPNLVRSDESTAAAVRCHAGPTSPAPPTGPVGADVEGPSTGEPPHAASRGNRSVDTTTAIVRVRRKTDPLQ